MTTYPNKLIKARDLQLGDEINCNPHGSGGWNTAIVKKVTDDTVRLFRPYGHHADFSYTGGVICYIGIEEFEVPKNDMEYYVYRRVVLK